METRRVLREEDQGGSSAQSLIRPVSWSQRTFLGFLTEPAREALLGLGTTREHAAGSTLIIEGDSCTDVFALIDGWVKVVAATADGGQALLGLRASGDLVGEQAALDNEPHPASVVSVGATVAQVIRQNEFVRFLREWPEAGLALSQALSAELRWAGRRRIDFIELPVPGRLARVLNELSQLDGHRASGGFGLGPTLTQPELAAMAGASEPAVHKALHQLETLDVATTASRGLRVCGSARGGGVVADKPPGIRRVCVAVRLDRPGRRGTGVADAARQRLTAVLADAWVSAGLHRSLLTGQGGDDGEVALLPPGIDEPRAVAALVDGLVQALRQVNGQLGGGARLRLRMAVHEGITILAAGGFRGYAIVKTGRLVDSQALQEALATSPDASLAVVFSDQVFEDVGPLTYPALPADRFRRVEIDDPTGQFRDVGWIYIPAQAGSQADDPFSD